VNPLTALVGGAIVGGADKYSQIQDEQRKYRIDEAKGEAEYNRQLNLARAKDQMGESGMMSAEGIPLSKEQLAALPEDQRSALKNPMQQAAEMQKIKESGQLSQFINPQTRERLTNAQVEEFTKNGGQGLVSVGALEHSDRIAAEGRSAGRANANQIESEQRQLRMMNARDEVTTKHETAKEAERDKNFKEKTEAAEIQKRKEDMAVASAKLAQAARRDELPPITGDKRKDLEAYQDANIAESLNVWKSTMSPTAYEKLVSSNKNLKDAENVGQFADLFATNGVAETRKKYNMTDTQVQTVVNFARATGSSTYETPGFLGSLMGNKGKWIGIKE